MSVARFASVLVLACAGACSSSGASRSAAIVTPDAASGGDDAQTPSRGGDASADVASPAPVPGTGGTGGLTCTRTDDLGGGRTSCVAKIGSVEVKVVAGKPGASPAPLRLGLYLHGDGAAAHKSNSVLKAMLPWADAQHGLAVSALAPNGCAWWLAPEHDCAGTQADIDAEAKNAAALVTALDAIMKAFDIRTDGMRYYGSSGGSIFLTDEWIPLHAGSHPGVFSLMCGGETSSMRTYAWDRTDAALRAKSPLWFTYGDKDSLVPNIKAAIADFKGKSFAVTEKVVPDAGHCTFDAHAEAIGIWTANP